MFVTQNVCSTRRHCSTGNGGEGVKEALKVDALCQKRRRTDGGDRLCSAP